MNVSSRDCSNYNTAYTLNETFYEFLPGFQDVFQHTRKDIFLKSSPLACGLLLITSVVHLLSSDAMLGELLLVSSSYLLSFRVTDNYAFTMEE